ncbi:hypothetical protein ElyMa_002926000 [Elysia marginata]|uniref:Uncharacterized protein n=1 Tax=Elysia marginata TaxID=1093978 RepID=A0AAV4I4K2_9GAST|nr:hypothetical protein ElyMa_002926000 [Elysia marginata]
MSASQICSTHDNINVAKAYTTLPSRFSFRSMRYSVLMAWPEASVTDMIQEAALRRLVGRDFGLRRLNKAPFRPNEAVFRPQKGQTSWDAYVMDG